VEWIHLTHHTVQVKKGNENFELQKKLTYFLSSGIRYEVVSLWRRVAWNREIVMPHTSKPWQMDAKINNRYRRILRRFIVTAMWRHIPSRGRPIVSSRRHN